MIDLLLAAALIFTWDPPSRGAQLEARVGAGSWQQIGLGLAPLSIPPGAMPGPGLIEYRATATGGQVPTASVYECAARSANCTPPGEAAGPWVVSAGCHAYGSSDSWIAPPLLCSMGGIDATSVRYEVWVEGYGGSVLVTPAALPAQVVVLPPGPPDAVVVAAWDLGDMTVPVTVEFVTASGAPMIDFIQARGVVPTPAACDGQRDQFRSCCQTIGRCE